MDQAALQWVSLEQSSGAPCWTAWGAREQQSLPTWLVRWRMRICDSITCPLYGWVETGLEVTADFCFAHSTALRVFQGRWRPGMYWTVLLLIRFFVGNEPCITRAILTKMKTVRLASWDEVTLLALWVCCLSVEPPCPLAHYTLHACWILRMVPWHLWFCPQRRLTASSARAVVGCAHIYPYETWGTAHLFCNGCKDFLHLVCRSSWTPLPFAPPDWGGIWYIKPPRHYYQQRLDTSLSVANYDLLDEHIWADAERGDLSKLNVQFSILDTEATRFCFDLHVSRNVVVDNSLCRLLWSGTVVNPLCPLANLCCGCCLFGPCPVFCLVCCFLLTKRKSGWGICGSSWLLVLCFSG